MIRILLLLVVFLLTSCAREKMEIMKESNVRSATKEILTFQDIPQEAALEYRWNALREYEEFIRDNKGMKSASMADSMHQLANIYMKIEENTYQRKMGKYDHSRSRHLYSEIMSLYPDRPGNERVLYHITTMYSEMMITTSMTRRSTNWDGHFFRANTMKTQLTNSCLSLKGEM